MREKRCSSPSAHRDEWISPVQSQFPSWRTQALQSTASGETWRRHHEEELSGEGEDSNGMQRYNQVLNALTLHKGHCHLIADVERVSDVEILVGVAKKKAKDRKL